MIKVNKIVEHRDGTATLYMEMSEYEYNSIMCEGIRLSLPKKHKNIMVIPYPNKLFRKNEKNIKKVNFPSKKLRVFFDLGFLSIIKKYIKDKKCEKKLNAKK